MLQRHSRPCRTSRNHRAESSEEPRLRLLLRIPVIAVFFAALFVQTVRAQEMPQPAAPVYEITGAVHSGKTSLPGATVTAANTLTGKKFAAASNPDGKFAFS